jgi:hypothetical protein
MVYDLKLFMFGLSGLVTGSILILIYLEPSQPPSFQQINHLMPRRVASAVDLWFLPGFAFAGKCQFAILEANAH